MAKSPRVSVAGVDLSSPERVLFAGQGITKLGLARYYERVADWILPHLADRPLTLVRCPRGRGTRCFVQRRANDGFPAFVRRVPVPHPERPGEIATYLSVDSLRALVYLAQIGGLELHTWSARRDRLDRPDRLILDLDPAPGLPWARVVGAAREVRDRLRVLGLESFVKTSGGKGLHVVAPLVRRHSWREVREFTRALAAAMAVEAPDDYLAHASKADREGRVYVDYLRNSWSASTVAAYSSRAKPGAPVSTPLAWHEATPALDPATLSVESVPRRLESLTTDPWAGYADARQSIGRAARRALGL